jgi:hypothetical protein
MTDIAYDGLTMLCLIGIGFFAFFLWESLDW